MTCANQSRFSNHSQVSQIRRDLGTRFYRYVPTPRSKEVHLLTNLVELIFSLFRPTLDGEREVLMDHYGSLETLPVSGDVHDVRGTTVRGSDGEKLGNVDDAIVDHDTMEIRYLVVDSGGWLEAGTFLLPADVVSADQTDDHAPRYRCHPTADQRFPAI